MASLRDGVAAALLSAAALLATRGAIAETATIDQGRALLETNCSRCHAIGLEGESTHKEAPPFRVVVMRYPPDNLAEALAEGLISGHPDMPEFVFEPDQVEAIVAYLNDLRAHSKAPEPKSEQKPE